MHKLRQIRKQQELVVSLRFLMVLMALETGSGHTPGKVTRSDKGFLRVVSLLSLLKRACVRFLVKCRSGGAGGWVILHRRKRQTRPTTYTPQKRHRFPVLLQPPR